MKVGDRVRVIKHHIPRFERQEGTVYFIRDSWPTHITVRLDSGEFVYCVREELHPCA